MVRKDSTKELDVSEYVDELRHNLKKILTEDMYEDTSMFMRFLKARNYDLKAAENMLRNDILWRKENKVDTISEWYKPHEVSEKYITLSPMAIDKDGAPVRYFDFGNMDIRGLLKSVKVNEITNFIIWRIQRDVEILKEQSEKTGKNIDQWMYVFNFENFPLAIATHKPSMDLIGKMINMYEGHYPERLKGSIVINATWYFQVGFNIVKPLISGPTFQKIKIFGKEGWKEELLSQIDVDQLPAFLGGNKLDSNEDPMCTAFLNHGGLVPEKYFAINNRSSFYNQPGMRKLIINRFGKELVEVNVPKPGSHIEWEFQTKVKDIAFSVLYKDLSGSHTELKEVLPKQRFDTSIAPEIGMYKCDTEGEYFLQFDNSYSWIRPKELYFKVSVRPPHTQTSYI